MPRFASLASFFTLDGSGPYVGRVIVSEDAMYFVASLAPMKFASLFAAHLSEKLTGETEPFRRPVTDLPPIIRNDEDWPLTTDTGFVCEFKRELLCDFRCSFFGNLEVSTPDHFAVMRLGFFPSFLAMKQLREYGWGL